MNKPITIETGGSRGFGMFLHLTEKGNPVSSFICVEDWKALKPEVRLEKIESLLSLMEKKDSEINYEPTK